MARHDIVCLHTMAGTFTWTDDWFHENGFGGTESHFGLAGSGRLKQWQDLDFSADANYDGNYRCISIETADRGEAFPDWSGSDVPPWTDAQLDVLVALVGWLCDRYDIPRELVPDSRPGRRGIAYHRQGIPPWKDPAGELWTKLPNGNGKVCPGDNRVAQIHEVILPRLKGVDAGNPFPALDPDEQRAALRLARKLEVRSRSTFPDISGEGRLAELVQGLQVLRGASGNGAGTPAAATATDDGAGAAGATVTAAATTARTEAWFTEVFRGAVLDGLRRPSPARPDRGGLRGPLKNLFRQVLAEDQG
jgi:hypothetical protein